MVDWTPFRITSETWWKLQSERCNKAGLLQLLIVDWPHSVSWNQIFRLVRVEPYSLPTSGLNSWPQIESRSQSLSTVATSLALFIPYWKYCISFTFKGKPEPPQQLPLPLLALPLNTVHQLKVDRLDMDEDGYIEKIPEILVCLWALEIEYVGGTKSNLESKL